MPHPKASAYVAKGVGGLIKVGFTVNPTERLKLLRKQFLAKGDELDAFHPCMAIDAGWSVERHLIAHCKQTMQRHSGFEWFTGGDFRALVAIAEAETEAKKDYRYKVWTPEELERIRLSGERRRKERAEADLRRAQWKLEHDKRAAARRWVRETGANAFAAIAAVLVPSLQSRSP